MEPIVGMTVWDMAGNSFVIERIMTRWGFKASGPRLDNSELMGGAIGKQSIAPIAPPPGAIGYDWDTSQFKFAEVRQPSEWSVGKNGAKIRS